MSHPMWYTYSMMIKEDKTMNTDNWYEVRVDGEKVAAFAPIRDDNAPYCSLAFKRAMSVIDTTRCDLYRGKVLSIVEVVERGGELRETVKYEEHPTVIEADDFRDMMPTSEELCYPHNEE